MSSFHHKFVLFLIGLFFIAPAGFGIPSVLGLLSLDLPKVIPFVLLVVIILKRKFKLMDKMTVLFLIMVVLHFMSIFYAENIKSGIVNFLSHILIFYPGFFIPYLIVNSEKNIQELLKMLNIAFVLLALIALTEFLFQVNVFDSVRNSYIDQDTRFNNNLGFIRLGFKASMGPFASTLPFAYTLACLYFLKDLHIPRFLARKKYVLEVVGFMAICVTLSRAAILLSLFILVYKNLFQKKIKNILGFLVVISCAFFYFQKQGIGRDYESYLNNYVFSVFSGDKNDAQGSESRLSNNLIDWNFALERPIMGHGSGMLRYNKIDGVKLQSQDSSYFLNVLADRGFVTLIIFMAILLTTLVRAYKLSRIKSQIFDYRSLSLALVIIIGCLSSSQRQEVLFLFFLVLGLINQIYLVNKKLC